MANPAAATSQRPAGWASAPAVAARCWAALEVPMPYAANLEHAALPNVERAYEAVKKAMYL